ncbi:MAG: carboxypeptidase-like regulatory domain-containing protein [Flammeovirgaceae bacterium]
MLLKAVKLSLLLLFLAQSAFAQVYRIVGKVLDGKTNESIPFATVYIDKTMIGTSTSAAGEFSLDFSSANVAQSGVEMVISCIGYESIIYQPDLLNLDKKFVFKLLPKEELLEEVEVSGVRDKLWYENLQFFKEQFLGRSEFGKQCEILNTDKLIISYYEQEKVLKVKARETLKIRNRSLGYEIDYLLDGFSHDSKTGITNYSGYTFFKEMKGGKAKQKKWQKNRQRAYYGSALHFLKSLYHHTLAENGFHLRRLKRIPNPNRPSKAEIIEARKTLRLGNASSLETTDKDRETLRRARLPKLIEVLDTNAVDYSSYTKKVNDELVISFKDFFQVVYTGEKEEANYVALYSKQFSQLRKPSFQTSVISLRAASTKLNKYGMVSSPFDILYEGYWSWEKLGETLPLGYELPSE